MANEAWFEGDDSVIEDASFKDYQITATPNDFNIKTIVDFVESGVVRFLAFNVITCGTSKVVPVPETAG